MTLYTILAQHSRVALQYKKPDYIHAMFVSGYSQRKDFIVAQQPLSRTVSDFWIMILQNHVTTVINLNEPDVTLRVKSTLQLCNLTQRYFPGKRTVYSNS